MNGGRLKRNCNASMTKPQPVQQGVVLCPAEVARTFHPHPAQSPSAGCPGEDMTLGEAGPCSKAGSEGAHSWRPPAAETPDSWAVGPSWRESLDTCGPQSSITTCSANKGASQRGLDGSANNGPTLQNGGGPPHSKWHLWTSSLDTTRELVRNAESALGPHVPFEKQAPHQGLEGSRAKPRCAVFVQPLN